MDNPLGRGRFGLVNKDEVLHIANHLEVLASDLRAITAAGEDEAKLGLADVVAFFDATNSLLFAGERVLEELKKCARQHHDLSNITSRRKPRRVRRR